MGKKYLDTKKHSVESSILSVWQEASLKQEKLDAVNKNAVKKKFDDRKDKDIDNDGDVDSSDKYLHKRRKAVSKAMKAREYGRIVNIASIFGHCTKEKRSCYTTSKFALVGMTKTLAVEMAPYNVLVNSVSPGFTATELTTRVLGTEGIAEMCKQVPMKRMAMPDEISKVVLFLSSEHNTYLTGQNIIVDGGFVNV